MRVEEDGTRKGHVRGSSERTILRLSLNIDAQSVYQTKTVGQGITARVNVKEMYPGCEFRQDSGISEGSTNRKAREAARASWPGELERPRRPAVFPALHQGSTVTQPYMPASRCGITPQTTR